MCDIDDSELAAFCKLSGSYFPDQHGKDKQQNHCATTDAGLGCWGWRGRGRCRAAEGNQETSHRQQYEKHLVQMLYVHVNLLRNMKNASNYGGANVHLWSTTLIRTDIRLCIPLASFQIIQWSAI